MAKQVLHVVAGLILQGDKFFIARRAQHDSNAGLWEFPGGKIEEGESPEQALARELEEELRLNVRVLSLYDQTSFKTSKATFYLSLYTCFVVSGQITLVDHSECAWIQISEIPNYNFLSGDKPFLERIQKEGLPKP